MPTRVNGIGTSYVGASNRQTFDGACEHCHRQAKLQNYETRLWFTVFFVPVIPLGRRQILSYCPCCTWHRALPLVQWQKITQEAIGESAAKWDENRDDPDAAIGMHSTLAAFNRKAEADRLAELLLQKFEDVSRVQFYLGGWYERTGRGEEADARFARAFELDPASLPARRAVAIGRMEQGRLAEARELLSAFEPSGPAFEPGLFFLLAKAYQKQEQHKEALELLKMLVTTRPSIVGEKEFRKSVRASERALGIAPSIVPTDRFYRSNAFRWAAAVSAVVVAILCWNLYVKAHRRVHIVNGLKLPISLQIDGGDAITVSPKGRTEVSLAEGAHRAEVLQPAGAGQPVEFSIEAAWLDRFFKKPVHVLDPARSAAIVWQSVVYRAINAQGIGGGNHHWHVGQPFTTYPDIDYRFEEFPKEIQLDHGRETAKTRVTVAEIDPVLVLALHAAQQGVTSDVLDYCESHLRVEPGEKNLLTAYCALAKNAQKTSRCREFLASKLDERPPLTEWHRLFQETSDSPGAHEALLRQYDGYLESDPGNSAFLYLRGRIDDDEAKVRDFMERARSADPANPHPWFALGYHLQAMGEFAGARKMLEQAVQLAPDDPRAGQLLETRFALGEFHALAAEARSELTTSPDDFSAQEQLLEALVAAGKPEEAQAAHDKFAAQTKGEGVGAYQPELISRTKLLYFQGRFEELLTAAAQMADPEFAGPSRFQALVELGRLEEAKPAPLPLETRTGYSELLLSVAWAQKGDQEHARAVREQALATLAAGGREERHVADLVKRAPAVPPGAAEKLVIEARSKAIVLVALAELCPDQKQFLLDLAERLNYRRQFPYHFLRRTIAVLRQ